MAGRYRGELPARSPAGAGLTAAAARHPQVVPLFGFELAGLTHALYSCSEHICAWQIPLYHVVAMTTLGRYKQAQTGFTGQWCGGVQAQKYWTSGRRFLSVRPQRPPYSGLPIGHRKIVLAQAWRRVNGAFSSVAVRRPGGNTHIP